MSLQKTFEGTDEDVFIVNMIRLFILSIAVLFTIFGHFVSIFKLEDSRDQVRSKSEQGQKDVNK